MLFQANTHRLQVEDLKTPEMEARNCAAAMTQYDEHKANMEEKMGQMDGKMGEMCSAEEEEAVGDE